MKNRWMCLLLVALMLMPMLLQAAPAALSAGGTVTKEETTRAIAVVFDNSGSMYGSGNDSWCRAQYALEVFAAMLNKGDRLMIYPMNKDVRDGASDGEVHDYPIVITDPSQAHIIRNMYSNDRNQTHFRAVDDAYAGLMAATEAEKHLVVLTDGTFTRDLPAGGVQNKLKEYSQDVFLRFIAIGTDVDESHIPMEDDPSRVYVGRANDGKPDSRDIVDVLAEACNLIFGRNTLPEDRIKESANENKCVVSFDVSMSKLILFVQGEDIDNVKFSGATILDDREVERSKVHESSGKVAEELKGRIVTIGALDAGDYELTYDGTKSKITVYYEPDVQLHAVFKNPDDVEFNPAKEPPYEGKYTLECKLVDNKGVETKSELLGDVKFTITCIVDGKTDQEVEASSATVELKEGQKFSAVFRVDFLNGYYIVIPSELLGWKEFDVVPRPAGVLRLKVEGGRDQYSLSSFEQEAVYNVTLTYNDEKLTGEKLDAVTLSSVVEGGNAKTEVEKTQDGFKISLKYNGDATSTALGDQSLVLSASYKADGDEPTNSGDVRTPFSIEDDSEAIKIELEINQPYYEIGKLDEGEPIIVNVNMGNRSMTSAEFENTTLEFDAGGIPFEVEADSTGACYVVKLKKDNKLEAGKYTITAKVTGKDSVGREVSDEAKGEIECQTYPIWVPWVVGGGLLLLLIVIIQLIRHIKVLPNDARIVENTFFSVGGKRVDGAFIRFSGKGSQKGNITVESPEYALNSNAVCAFTLDVVAEGCLKDKSARRKVRVVGVKVMDPYTTRSLSVDGEEFTVNKDTGTLVRSDGDAVDFTVQGSVSFTIICSVTNPANNHPVNCTLTGEFEFL